MKYIKEQIWTLAAAAYVIITLSGDVRTQALLISVVALGLHGLASIIGGDEDE